MTIKYKSIFTDKEVDEANHVTELFIKRCCELDNSGNLPRNFWNMTKYKNMYIREVSQAHILLRTYSVIAIVKAMQSPKASRIRSMRNKNLIPLIKVEQEKIKESTFVESSGQMGHRSNKKGFDL